jgi:S-adenosyl methyltransferase
VGSYRAPARVVRLRLAAVQRGLAAGRTLAAVNHAHGDEPDEVETASSVNADRPNAARMYDYALGGSANFEADRKAVHAALKADPEGRLYARANRAFLGRVVATLVGLGIRQFVDLGSGVPTVGHVHEIAHRTDPGARVVYVDNEPVAYQFSRQVLAGVGGTAVLPLDLRDVRGVLGHPNTRALINLDEPVAVLMFAVLHFITNDREVADLVAAYRDSTVPGSYLAISHACGPDTRAAREIEELYERTSSPFRNRTASHVTELFAGYELLEPGVVPVSDWRPAPGPDPNRPSADVLIAAVGRRG